MVSYRIYLAGAMGTFGKDRFEESNKWRKYIQNELPKIASYHGSSAKLHITNPNDHFNFLDNSNYKSEREIKEFDLYKAKRSDLIIVNFNVNNSIGTSKELAICHDKGIPIIGLDEKHLELHPWDIDDCNRIFDNMKEMLEYITIHYLLD